MDIGKKMRERLVDDVDEGKYFFKELN